MTFFNREREWKFYMEEIFSLNNNLLIHNNVSLNGNLSGTNANLTETLTANTIHVNELHLGPNTLYIDNEAILYKHNGNLLMSVNHFHGDLTGNLISKNTFVNGNIIIGNNFGIKFDDGTTITSGNITSTSGGGTSNVTPQEIDDRISNYLFNKPEAPTDSSHNFQFITSNDGTHPTITLLWSNPPTKRVAFPFGTTPGYNIPVTGNFINDFNSNKNITHLPYSKELKIEFHEENTPNSWSNLTLNSDGTGITQHIIPNSVITANLNSSNIAPTLLANTVSNTYTEFKSGKGLTIGNKYQFRIYLTNEITEEDASYNYLYIPSETEYIAFGGFANVTAPTEILFPTHVFNNLQIKGINGNIYAETEMNTPFPIPDNFDLRVRYGFDIDISSNINSKQMSNERANSNSGYFKTAYLRDNNFTETITLSSGLLLTNNNIIKWYPEFDYNVSNFFMEANLDISGNIAETTIGNSITTVRPSRGNLLASTKYLGNLNQSNFTNDLYGLSFPDISNSTTLISGENIYNYDIDTPFENVYIIDNTNSFNIRFNPNIEYLINNNDSHIGIDSVDISLCQFVGNIVINNSNIGLIQYYYRIPQPITTPSVTTYKLVYTSYEESLQLGNNLFSSTYMHNWYGKSGTTNTQSYIVASRAELFVREVIDPLISSQGNIDIYYKAHKPSEHNGYYPYFVSSYEEYYKGSTLSKVLDGVYAWPGYDGTDNPYGRRAGRRDVNSSYFRYFAVKDTTNLEDLGYTLYQSPTNDPDMIYKSTNFSKGFLQVIDLSAHPFDENYVGNIKDGMIINANVIENSSIKGYYTDINLFEIGVRNVNLTHYQDMADINYKYYKASVNQIVNNNTILNNVGNIYFNFGIAEKSISDISFSFQRFYGTSIDATTNKFYGIPRIETNYIYHYIPGITFRFDFINKNTKWRRNIYIVENIVVKLLSQEITFSNTLHNLNWDLNTFTQVGSGIDNSTWNIITNSTNNNYFSRYNETNPQFNVTFTVNNNIGFSNTLSYNEDFNWNNSNDVLWWDYTWGINNIIPSNVFSKPSSLTIQLCESINPFTSGNTIPNLFNHDNKITYETAMWSKDGWCGANITLTNDYNPYIDYRQYNLITDISYDYSIFDNSGINQTINYGLNVYSGDSSSQAISFTNLKWLIFKLQNSTQNTNNLQFNTNLSWLTDYIVFYLEEDYNNNNGSYSIIDDNGSTITSSKTYWLDVQNTSINSGAIMNFITGQSQTPIGSNNGCNAGDSGDNIKIINRFRGGNSLINQYIAFGIRPEKKLKTITFSYV